MTSQNMHLYKELDELAARAKLVIDAIVLTEPGTSSSERPVVNRVRHVCYALLETAGADGLGGCDLCRS